MNEIENLLSDVRVVAAQHEDFRAARAAKADAANTIVGLLRELAWAMRGALAGSDGCVRFQGFPLAVGGSGDGQSWWLALETGNKVSDADACAFGAAELVERFREELQAHLSGGRPLRTRQIWREARKLEALAVLLDGLVRK